MSIAPATPRLMTAEELLALPEDGTERELIRGVVIATPAEDAMTIRNKRHGFSEGMIAYFLNAWRLANPQAAGIVVTGETGFRLRRDPDTVVGVDVAYVSRELMGTPADETNLFEGPPILAVEVLSPSDKKGKVDDKISEYLSAGVSIVWIVDPRFRTVTIYRPDAVPVMVGSDGHLTAEPHLPGLRIPVTEIFVA